MMNLRRGALSIGVPLIFFLLSAICFSIFGKAIFDAQVFVVRKDEQNGNDVKALITAKSGDSASSLSSSLPSKFDEDETEQDFTTVRPIQQISLIGERNSGTKWMTAHLTECFNHSIPVRDRLVRHKHWFQEDLTSNDGPSTLVVAQFRSPCQWVESMRLKNHHAPLHFRVDWETYVTTPWTMPRLKYDLKLLKKARRANRGDQAVNTSKIECQENFRFNQVNSCLKRPYTDPPFKARKKDDMSGHEPFYELRLDGSGRAYSSVVDLRADKIRNFLAVSEWEWIEDLLTVQYEDLVERGTSHLLKRIEQLTGVEAKCRPVPPAARPPRKLPPDFVAWMTKHVDWESEALVGYHQC